MVSLSTVAEYVNIAPCPYPTLSQGKVFCELSQISLAKLVLLPLV